MQQVCQALAHDPGDPTTAGIWAGQLAMSTMSSLAMLLQGTPITRVDLSSGYESHSAYATSQIFLGCKAGSPEHHVNSTR